MPRLLQNYFLLAEGVFLTKASSIIFFSTFFPTKNAFYVHGKNVENGLLKSKSRQLSLFSDKNVRGGTGAKCGKRELIQHFLTGALIVAIKQCPSFH